MTEERNKNEHLKRLDSIIETAIDGIITIDQDGNIESINPAAAKLFEYSLEEVIGKNVNLLMPEPYHSEHDQYISRYIRTKEAQIIGKSREVQGKKKSGQTFPCRLAVSEVVLQDKIVFTGIIHDLSDYKKAQEEYEKLNKELEQRVIQRTYQLEKVVNQLLKTNKELKSEIFERKKVEEKLKEREGQLKISLSKERELGELKTRFVSMASHEFRTPLATVLSSAALLSRYTKSEQQDKREKHIHKIKNSVAHLTNLLNDFLSLGKLEEGKAVIIPEYIELHDLCADIIDELSGMLGENQQLKCETFGEIKKLYVDKKILKNILFNLVSNAIKYSDTDVLLKIHYRDEDVKMDVIDWGIGIPEEDQKHLFSRFFRASNVTNIQGTGLGLNIVKRYVNLLGGRIEFKSKYNEGTTFSIFIPYETKS
jgi:PAS domain S-box-containing protein